MADYIENKKESMLPGNREGKKIALMSGKGGSGKTSIIATIAKILSRHNIKSKIIDADLGTGGMTFYLGLKQVPNKRVGIANLFIDHVCLDDRFFDQSFQKFKDDDHIDFLGLGSFKYLYKKCENNEIYQVISKIINEIKTCDGLWVLIDCRGGVDDGLLKIAKSVDDIIFVVEPDTTSFQANQHIAEVLIEEGFGNKIKGFIINKVFDDPSSVARSGAGVFGGQYLAALPYDLEAMRSFLIGEIPKFSTLFGSHVWSALNVAYPKYISPPKSKILRSSEYGEISTLSPNSEIGGFFLTFAAIIFGTYALIYEFTGDCSILPFYPYLSIRLIIILLITVSILNGNNTLRSMFGSAFRLYFQIFKRILTK